MNYVHMFAPLEQTVEKLKGLLQSQREKNAVLEKELHAVQNQKEELLFKYNTLRKMMFGSKSEKFSEKDEKQGRLFDEIEDTVETEAQLPKKQIGGGRKRTRRKSRNDWINKVDFKDIVHDLGEDEKKCLCGATRSRIGEEVLHKLDVIPAQLVGERHIRYKYACKSCEGVENEEEGAVKIAPPPEQLIPKSMATPGLLAYLATGKFVDHLPFYRMESLFSRMGASLSRANMCNWMIQINKGCERLAELLLEDLRQSPVIGADETPMQVMREPERKNTTKSQMWLFRSQSLDRPILLYQYRKTKSADFLDELLAGFQGTLLSDGYKGYDKFCNCKGLHHAGCWAHVRREFKEVLDQFPNSRIAGGTLKLIRRLYAVERLAKAKNLSFDDIRALRQEKSAPVIRELRQFLDDAFVRVPPSGPAGKAIKYALNQWPKLLVYLDDGRVPIDNNSVENGIRPFVMGRKNWMISGGPRGAHASAWLYSLVESAKANDLEPYWYLRYLFEMLPKAKSDDDLRALLPHRIDRSLVKPLLRPQRY